MTASERAEFITGIYALRSQCGSKSVLACGSQWLKVAAFLAEARDALTLAIQTYEEQQGESVSSGELCPNCGALPRRDDQNLCPACCVLHTPRK